MTSVKTLFAKWRREWAAASTGALLILSFPKFGHGLLAWIALLPLLLALRDTSPSTGLRLGFITGIVSSIGLLYWTSLVVIQFGGLHYAVAVLVMILLASAVALFPALFAATVAYGLRRFGVVFVWLAPAAWVATEMLRAYTFFRFPWCLLGYSQHEHPVVIQIASLTAVYGVSFLVVLCSAALAYQAFETRTTRRRATSAACLALIAAILIWGTSRVAHPPASRGSVRVGLVQASILQDEKWDPDQAAGHLESHVRLTRLAAASGARIVIWPESSVPYLVDYQPAIAQQLADLARERGISLMVGTDDLEANSARRRLYVGARLYAPTGAVALRYHKMRLVPFGEYVPLSGLLETLGVKKLVQEVGDFVPGEAITLGRAEGRTLGAFICYEAIFPDLVREFAQQGAELLVNITNDGWYGRTSAPYQHLAMARFRAVENGRPLLRAANTGITAIIDARGRVQRQTQLFERTVLVDDVEVAVEDTFYARHGDVFGWLCCAVTLAMAIYGGARRAPAGDPSD